MKISRLTVPMLFIGIAFSATAQDGNIVKLKPDSEYDFTVVKNLEATPVQNQFRTGTCWSFSALAFLESELIRTGKGEQNLSEMFVVNHTYKDKAERFVRMHGHTNFGAGGAFVDAAHVWEKYGMIPESVYNGLNYGSEKHDHSELDGILTAYVKTIGDGDSKKLTPNWKQAFDGIVDSYLGTLPETFEYDGATYTPKSYAASLGLKMDDYVSITSFTHHDFYDKFVLEIPDNWLHVQSYNVPIDELMTIIDEAIDNGYTLAWGADVSEKGFAFREGLALLPEDDATIQVKGKDNSNFSDAGAEKVSNAFERPVPQKAVTQEMRQVGFDNWETTDDHGMQITGIVNDQNGDKYYIVKNSWGTEHNKLDGYFFASEAYVRLKTMNIYLHKQAVPKDLAKKLSL